MTEVRDSGKLLLPALRARMGDWIYYVTVLQMEIIAERVQVAGEIHEAKTLNDFIQRQLDASGHSAQIAAYLLNQQQRFFNSMVLAVYEGAPQWFELEVKRNELLDPDEELSLATQALLGFLRLEGTEKIFAVDGQHRVVGIKQALAQDATLGSQEVSVILVGHENTEEGKERTRRLFTTLNRYAKPVTKGEIIALDEDDLVAIVTRRLVNEHPLFRDKVSSLRTKNISPQDRKSFTSIVSIYDALDIYLPRSRYGWRDFKRRRPPDSEIEGYYQRAADLWDRLISKFPPLAEVARSAPSAAVVSQYRNEEIGGHLLFRPIGLELVVKVIRQLLNTGLSIAEATSRVAAVPMYLGDWPWAVLLWSPVSRRMITAPENQRAATRLLFYLCGGELARIRSSVDELQDEIAALTNTEAHSVRMTL
jgi:DNA sulfur modification protein DndB